MKVRIFRIIKYLLLAILVLAAGLFAVITVTEYKPEDIESVDILEGSSVKIAAEGDSLKVVTWNIGYGALGDNADFFMDGGKSVYTSSEERVRENMEAINRQLELLDADVIFLQEIEINSARSYRINEKEQIEENLSQYSSSFAYNFNTYFLPYPLPPMGHVESGILSLTKYEPLEASRIQLPCPFRYPVSAVNLKRCLLLSRIPLENSDKQLVLINLHLEAYDSGEGKLEQTKQLKELIESEVEKGNYVIAGGDFNQKFSSVDTSMYPLLDDDYWACGEIDTSVFDESLQFAADNTTPSCRLLCEPYENADKENFQYYLIDGFIVSGNITINSCTTLDLGFVSSDHNPVELELTLN